MAILLTNAAGRVIFCNAAARALIGDGRRLEGRKFGEVIAALPAAVRDGIEGGAESIFSITTGDRDETYRFVRREFFLNTQRQTLFMLERLTAELRRQELEVWKRAIRTMNHELNNSIAPLSSLLHSARCATGKPQHAGKLDEIYDTIDDRLSHLRDFLEAYARFARLPAPRKSRVPWRAVLDDVARLYPFEAGPVSAEEGLFDRAQIEQVLINLVKNAHQSGSAASEVKVSVIASPEGTRLRVVDRGCGMADDVLRQALLPFYSTKPDGTGLGLALASEIVDAHGGRLALQRREGGGMAVTVTLPSP
jgi:signal transduction histidine kinase